MMNAMRHRINDEGYLIKVGLDNEGGKHKKKSVKVVKDWWLAKPNMNLTISGLPERYWGKRIKIKIIVLNDEEVEEDEV